MSRVENSTCDISIVNCNDNYIFKALWLSVIVFIGILIFLNAFLLKLRNFKQKKSLSELSELQNMWKNKKETFYVQITDFLLLSILIL